MSKNKKIKFDFDMFKATHAELQRHHQENSESVYELQQRIAREKASNVPRSLEESIQKSDGRSEDEQPQPPQNAWRN